MVKSKDIYQHLQNYIKYNPSDKEKKTYILSCARPAWIVGWYKNYEYSTNSHVDAIVHFYEKVLEEKIQMQNGEYLDLFDYVLSQYKNIDKYSLQELSYLIISFYFAYDGFFDCGLYIMNLDQAKSKKGMFLDKIPPNYCVRKNHK